MPFPGQKTCLEEVLEGMLGHERNAWGGCGATNLDPEGEPCLGAHCWILGNHHRQEARHRGYLEM